jgi:uncharacterized protein (TIGR03435 family)
MRRWLTGSVLIATAVVAGVRPGLRAQPPTFEAASVKPNRSGEQRSRFDTPGNRYIATNVTLNELIGWAYGDPGPPPELRPNYQMSGGPSWKDTDHFDVDAITGNEAPAESVPFLQRIQLKMLMLQTLLAERFKLSVHHDTREGPVYSLVLASRDGRVGPQLLRSETDCNAIAARGRIGAGPAPPPPTSTVPGPLCGIRIGLGTLQIGSQSIPAIARLLARAVGRPVLDRTGLNGAFDLSLDFDTAGLPGYATPPGVIPPNTADKPSLYTALQEQSGLKLEAGRGPIDILIVDHVEHPTPD